MQIMIINPSFWTLFRGFGCSSSFLESDKTRDNKFFEKMQKIKRTNKNIFRLAKIRFARGYNGKQWESERQFEKDRKI